MKINQKILSIPPYISTAWRNIASIHIQEQPEKKILMVTLTNESIIEIPNLNQAILEEIFSAHSRFIESESQEKSTIKSSQNNAHFSNKTDSALLNPPFGTGINGLHNLNMVMHHNQEQAHSPDLPPEILEKITAMTKSLGIEGELNNMPKAEPHCNCFYCQISRSLHKNETFKEDNKTEEELVSDEDLTFSDWIIDQTSDNLFTVTHPLNANEHYQVFLGNPVGCTCGEKNCEHIRIVLNS